MMSNNFFNQEEANKAYDRRVGEIKKAGAVRAIGSIGLDLFSPFKPKLRPPSSSSGIDLRIKSVSNEERFGRLLNAMTLSDARKATASRVSSFNAFAAQRGTLPQTVANLYLSRIMEPLSEARSYIDTRVTYNSYLASMNKLAYTNSSLSQYDNALYSIQRANDNFNHNLLHTVFNLGVNYFMPLP
jgi:hypothetical protein